MEQMQEQKSGAEQVSLIASASLDELTEWMPGITRLMLLSQVEKLGYAAVQYFGDSEALGSLALKAAKEVTDTDLAKELAYFGKTVLKQVNPLQNDIDTLIRQVKELLAEAG